MIRKASGTTKGNTAAVTSGNTAAVANATATSIGSVTSMVTSIISPLLGAINSIVTGVTSTITSVVSIRTEGTVKNFETVTQNKTVREENENIGFYVILGILIVGFIIYAITNNKKT